MFFVTLGCINMTVSPFLATRCEGEKLQCSQPAICSLLKLCVATCALLGPSETAVCRVVSLKEDSGFIFMFNLETKSMEYFYTLGQSYFDYSALYLLWIFLLSA